MRCLPRSHRISIGVVHETYAEPPPPGFGTATLMYTPSAEHKGDFLTKYLDAPMLENALDMIQVKRYCTAKGDASEARSAGA